MATGDVSRRTAQARLARQMRAGNYEPQFGRIASRSRELHREYLEMLLDNPDAIRPEDEKMLARNASYALWEEKSPGSHPNADPRYAQWSEFFYHNNRELQ